jgi:raffinose/stachyose/melibiose transport system substrate-binding protein
MSRTLRIASALFAVLLLGSTLAQDLTFWSWRTEDVDAYETFIDAFQEMEPGIDVDFEPYRNTEYNTILSTAMQGGGGPDIAHLRAYGGMEPLAQAGHLVRLDGEISQLEDFDPGILLGATNRADGGVYGVPFALQTIQVLYNVTMFEELGLEEPTTWDEFIAVAEALQESGVNALANGTSDPWTVETLFGGVAPSYYGCTAFFDEISAGATDFTDPRFRAGLERMTMIEPYLAENHTGIGYTDMQTLFAFEQAGMLIGGSYELGVMADLNPMLEIGAFPVPPQNAGDETCISFYVDGSYGVNAATEHRDAAMRFVEFLATPEFGQMFTDELQQISAVPGVQPTSEPLGELAGMMNEMGTPYLMLTSFRFGQPSGSTLLQNEMQAVLGGDQDLDTAIANIQRGVAEWFDFD